MLRIVLPIALGIFFFAQFGFCDQSLINVKEMEIITFEYKSSVEKSSTIVSIHKEIEPNGILYKVKQIGKGQTENFVDVSWNIESIMQERKGSLFTLESKCHIRDRTEKTLRIYKKIFDYENNVIQWESYNDTGSLKKKKIFPIKGKTCDDTTLIFFLNSFTDK